MATTYGYREGVRRIITLPVDSSSLAIEVGDQIAEATAGYMKAVTATSDVVIGVATSKSAIPGSDGALTVEVDVSQDSIYEYPPDAGTVTAGLAQRMTDSGGALSINIDASSVDCWLIQRVDTVANTVFVSLVRKHIGVV